MKRLAVIAIALLFSARGAAAYGTGDGNLLLRECTTDDSTMVLSCIAYISGARDMFDLLQLIGSGGERCIPQQATNGQVSDVVIRHLRQHPETRHFNREVLILTAIREAWCPDGSPTISRIPEQPQWKPAPKKPTPVNRPTKPLPLDTE